MQLSLIKESSRYLRSKATNSKNKVLKQVAQELKNASSQIIQANQKDLSNAEANGLSSSLLDRLLLDESRIESMVNAINHVIELDDPVGKVVEEYTQANGLVIKRERVPLGVIFMIYESRPNVTIDAACLAFKSGNAILLRGGSESLNTNQALLNVWQNVLAQYSEIAHAVSMVDNQSHQTVKELLKQDAYLDLVIPRGGERLIRTVVEQSRIPVLKHFQGVCHCFIDQTADLDRAINIIADGKLSRPGVCNALETLLVHQNINASFWRRLEELASQHRLELRCCESSLPKMKGVKLASQDDFGKEFLAKIMAVKQVSDVDEAIEHIQRFGSQHTEVIVSNSDENIRKFKIEVDAAVIMDNCSSRFSDGGELGLGAEIGISTTKLHAYGPMGLEALTIPRFVVKGEGQVRHKNFGET